MQAVLERDVEALRAALDSHRERVNVFLSRQTVATLTTMLTDEGPEEVSPTEAALMLRMSRPVIRRLMDRGALPYRMVGTHHRIPVSAIEAFDQAERARMRQAGQDFTDLENELGLDN